MRILLAVSDGLDRLIGVAGKASAWLLVVNTVVICFDVVTRKFGFQLPGLGSTRLQELEWHFHTAIFAFWLGLTYIRNGHVRIDILSLRLSPRGRVIVEILGCLLFALPYTLLLLYGGWDFFERSWMQNESSDAPTGLPARYIIKFVLFAGIVLLLLAVLSVLCRRLAELLAPAAATEPPR
ncbi:MAG: TRAP transporter small permease subunit [Proteobacteria bacterium]|nr:TRAP transporter small permease subunit [Pseudomonadota bacterium]